MDIIEALKAKEIRIDNVNRWLVWDTIKKVWVIYGRERAQKYTRTIVVTGSEEIAIKYLLYEEVE